MNINMQNNKKERRAKIIVPLLYMAFIFILSSIPATEDNRMAGVYIQPTLQNILHIPLYAVLAWLWMRAFTHNGLKAYSLRLIAWTLVIVIAYALFDELHQYFVPGRYISVADLSLNALGCMLGLSVYMFTKKPLADSINKPVDSKKNKRLKILFMTTWYPTEKNPVNGVFIREHAKAVSLYNDVTVMHLDGYDRSVKGLFGFREVRKEENKTFRVNYRRFPIPFLKQCAYFNFICTAIMAFAKLQKMGFKPAIIHANVYDSGVPAVIIGKLCNIPVVISEHFSAFPKKSLPFSEVKKAKFCMERSRAVLPVSNYLRKSIENHGIKNRFHVIPNVVDVKLFYPSHKNKDAYIKRILLVALLDSKKGVPHLLKALSMLKNRRSDFILDIVGDGPEREKYEKMADALGIAEKINFYGTKTKKEVATFMQKSHFFVLPSPLETFGVVLIEALASGLPVIATNIGGPSEIINNNVGILIQPASPIALEKAIDYMLNHYKDYDSEALAKYTREKFSYEVIGNKINHIYQDILGNDYSEYPAGNSGYRLKIRNDWRVLDVGSGHNPHVRANVILDKYVDENKERAGQSIKRNNGQEFVKGDACAMEFKNKEFDYVIASHIAEHVDEPEKFCKELMRIGYRGYIETPSPFTENVLGEPFHKWFVYKNNGILIFKRINKNKLLKIFSNFFYAIYYLNVKREGKKTFCFSNKDMKYYSNKLITLLLRNQWLRFKKVTYTCFEWTDKFKYEVIE